MDPSGHQEQCTGDECEDTEDDEGDGGGDDGGDDGGAVTWSEEYGLCINILNIGCTGGSDYADWWVNENIPLLMESAGVGSEDLSMGERLATSVFVVPALIVIDAGLIVATITVTAALAADPEPATKAGLLLLDISISGADVAVAYLHIRYAMWVATGDNP